MSIAGRLQRIEMNQAQPIVLPVFASHPTTVKTPLIETYLCDTSPLPARPSADTRTHLPSKAGRLLAMNSGVSKQQARRSRVKPSKAYQEALLDAVEDTGAGM